MQRAPIDLIPLDDVPPQRWFNGGGWTREIARGGGAQDWDWRLSVADVEADGPFSRLPGIEREIYLLEGAGMQFDFADGEAFALTPESPRLRFDGGRALDSRLIDGPTRDFNLMWRRDALDAELLHRPLVGNMLFFTEPQAAWAIHLLAGQARFDDAALPPLQAGDTAWLGAGERRRYSLDGGGELLAIRITPARSAA